MTATTEQLDASVSGDAPTIALLSPSGWGNLGDAAIVESALFAIRKRHPRARVMGFTLNPADTSRRHGIPAFPISSFARPHYGIVSDSRGQALAHDVERRLTRLPLVGPLLGRAWAIVHRTLFELQHLARSYRQARDLDLLIVCGGGQLDEYWGGAWGHPYALFKWTTLTRLAGKPVAVLSVGAGAVRSPLSRWFIRRALRTADFRSYRDPRTLAQAERLGSTEEQSVQPDLAFGMPLPPPRAVFQADGTGTSAAAGSLTIGVSPIAYLDPRVWPVKDAAAYARYVGESAQLVAALLDRGHRIVLFATDGPDDRTIDDVLSALGEERRTKFAGAIARPSIGGTDDLLRMLGGLDLAIASRLHGVKLAHVCGTPVLALSYDWKVDQHMADMDESSHCLPIAEILAPQVLAAVDALAARLGQSAEGIRVKTTARAAAVSQQWTRVFDALVDRRVAAPAYPTHRQKPASAIS